MLEKRQDDSRRESSQPARQPNNWTGFLYSYFVGAEEEPSSQWVPVQEQSNPRAASSENYSRGWRDFTFIL